MDGISKFKNHLLTIFFQCLVLGKKVATNEKQCQH